MHAAVVVLGDLGRSPRMQYHALSLLEEGHHVSLVGYEGEGLIPELQQQERLQVIRFRVPSPKILQKSLPVYFAWRILSMTYYLFTALWVSIPNYSRQRPAAPPVSLVLVQNPPAVPLLAVAWLYCKMQQWFRKQPTALVIDWHNLGYSMLSNPIFSRMARMYESFWAPSAQAHLTVTQALKDYLIQDFKIPSHRIAVVRDCPPARFQPLSLPQQHALWQSFHAWFYALYLQHASSWPFADWIPTENPGDTTLFTRSKGKNSIVPRQKRPALITSSTSWTPDEDFGQLLLALEILDAKITSEKENDLTILVLVTGKGPLRVHYQKRIQDLKLKHILIQTIWLEAGDYPKLLACADVGVSLHTSTSGMDLPMKILDLFGCQTPVCAVDFSCLKELVEDDENGRTFSSPMELAAQLWYLLKPLGEASPPAHREPHGFGDLKRYSDTLKEQKRWKDNWTECAWPALERAHGFGV